MTAKNLDDYLRAYQPGDVIFREGEVGDTVLLIKSGSVEVLKGEGANQRSLATISEGEVVGEMALEEGEHERTATVKAETDVEGWRFPGPAFESLIDKDRTFRQKLFRSLLSRLAETTDRLAEQETTELKTLNRLLVDASPLLLSRLNSSELTENNDTRTVSPNHSLELLAYHFDTDLESVKALRSLNRESPEELDEDLREQVHGLARDVVKEATNLLELESENAGKPDEELVQAAKAARTLLEKLEDHTETYGNEKLQKIMEKRQEIREILEERKSAGRDDYLISLTEGMLDGIKQEINIRYD